MKIKEFFKTLFSIRVYIKLPKINWRALRKRTKVIFTDRHAGDGTGWDIPEEDIEALADIILPGIIKFYSTKEGREEFLAWKKECEMKLAQEQEQHFLERKQENERLLQNNKKIKHHNRHIGVTERRANDRSNIRPLFLGQSARGIH